MDLYKLYKRLRDNPEEQNLNTIVENNAVSKGDGGADQLTDRGGQWPLSGIKRNNYYGNYSWAGNDGWDGSWVLNGTKNALQGRGGGNRAKKQG